MTDPTAGPSRADPPQAAPPAAIPGERRLAHPPSDRYRTTEPPSSDQDNTGSLAMGVTVAAAVAVAGAVATIVLGGVLAVSAGLLVVAGATGWAIAVGLRAGAGGRLTAGRRVRLAMALALTAVVVGQLGLWIYARTQGGVLGPLDYLAETFGLLVPVELIVASLAAWAAAR